MEGGGPSFSVLEGVFPGLLFLKFLKFIKFSKFLKFDVPGLHILNIRPLTQEFKMPFAPIPVPEIGVGGLYAIEKYNVWVAGICLIVVSSSVLAVGIHSKRKIRQHLIQDEPDSLL